MDMNLSKLRETVENRGTWYAIVHGGHRVRHNLAIEQQNNSVTHFIFFLCLELWSIFLKFLLIQT